MSKKLNIAAINSEGVDLRIQGSGYYISICTCVNPCSDITSETDPRSPFTYRNPHSRV